MGWDEKLFGMLFRAVRPRKGAADQPHAQLLEPLRTRLAVFGAAVARQKVEIGVAEHGGRRVGATLLLPAAIALAPDADLNARAYLVRVAVDATSLRLGLEPPRPLGDVERMLFSLLSLPAVLATLAVDLPVVPKLLVELGHHALSCRPSIARMPPRAAAVELLVRRRLGAPWSALERDVPQDVLRLARGAEATRSPTAAGIMVTLASLGVGLRAEDVVPVVLWGATGFDSGGRAPAVVEQGQTPGSTGTERTGKPREDVRVVTLDDSPLEDNPMTHSFEKVHTAEEFSGGKKNVDGSDELGAHGDALDEVEMREVVRSRERAHSLYRAEVTFQDGDAGADVEDPGLEGGVAYDEWDERAGSYRKAHCRVFVSHAMRPADPGAAMKSVSGVLQKHRRQVRDLESRFERIEQARRERGRQPDGTEIDIDAIVERHGALAAGHTGADNLYVARRPHVQDLAVLILLDASLSSDAWVANRRVLDVAKEAVYVVGQALSVLSVRTGVAAFFSNTRRDCRFVVVKSFAAEWSSSAARLATVTPTGYTRIGPALRHGTHLLEETGARRKLLLMVGDGKPTDFDRYEGRYGIGDVRQAVREAEQRGIETFALAIDDTARRQLPAMFGPKGFEILRRPEDLVGALGRVCADLAR